MMIILSDENLKNMFLTFTVSNEIISSSHGKTTQQNEETCIGYSLSANDNSMNGTWNTYL